MTLNLQWLYLLPLFSVILSVALVFWRNSKSQYRRSNWRLLVLPNLHLYGHAEPRVQPILFIIRMSCRKLLKTGDDEEDSSFVARLIG
ncbi:MAG: hypothetical protein A2201_02845 [Alicyclobacillus sp. RIFOXYA1_FULL_53_8]|nr:MAG: hypothetical protein A2201_02845 [Alicyclobacillus sp. RIFOXYA1_FULL_53_8]